MTFSEPVILTNNDAVNSLPQIASSDDNIYLVWFHSIYRKDGTLNSTSILFTRSIDQGASFGNVTKIAENSRLELGIPRMIAFENNVYMIWRLIDEANNIYAVFFARSSDGGVTFSKPVNLNSIPRGFPSYEIGTYPAIAVSGGDVYVVWSDITSEGNYEIFLVASTDEGGSFTEPINLSNSEISAIHPEIAVSGNTAYVVWTEYIPKGLDVFFSKASIQSSSVPEVPKIDASWKIHNVIHEGQTFKIPVKITNGNVKEIERHPEFDSVILSIETSINADGEINITIPRNLLDPKVDHRDDEFIVLVDGSKVEYEEFNKSPCLRSLAIRIPAGSAKVEIIYAVIPEFYSPPITIVPTVHIATDKNYYESGESIRVSGCTDLALDDKEVIVVILNPEGKMYRRLALSPSIDGSFSTSFRIEGDQAINGTYTAKATYAGKSATSTFVVPEFTIALLALIISFIAVTGYTRLCGASKYAQI